MTAVLPDPGAGCTLDKKQWNTFPQYFLITGIFLRADAALHALENDRLSQPKESPIPIHDNETVLALF